MKLNELRIYGKRATLSTDCPVIIVLKTITRYDIE